MSRDLVARGHRVTGVDVSPTLARLAAESDRRARYLLADGAMLPFRAGAFDLVVAYNSLMDVDDMPAVCAEIGRVLEPGRRLCVCVQHPVWDAGRCVGQGPEAAFVLGPTYFGPRPFAGTYERNGLSVTFRGWCSRSTTTRARSRPPASSSRRCASPFQVRARRRRRAAGGCPSS